ncbi:MAG: SCP2 sterol-binding domain-containing protein [Pseudobdellovibrionaceae bacterium]
MTLEDIVSKIRQKATYDTGFRARVLFDFGDEGCVFFDATQSPAEIITEEREADVTLSTSLDNFGKILEGQLDPNMAFMMGKLKVRGSMGKALKLNAFLEG